MRFHKTIAFTAALAAGSFVGACATPQPTFECNALPPFWAFYTLESGAGNGACAEIPGDQVTMQRYLAPGSTDAKLAVLPYRVGILRNYSREDTGEPVYLDPADPKLQKESSIGHFETLKPGADGVCKLVNVEDAVQNYPEVDDGTTVYPALSLRYKWENLRILSTAEFPGTLFDATVTITEDACTAKYKVYGVHPIVPCDTDVDCDPNPDLDAGRVLGSGMNAAMAPRCVPYPANTDVALKYGEIDSVGICGPSAANTFDALVAK